jgi:hypothetical protein
VIEIPYLLTPGRCRVCGCTELKPCQIRTDDAGFCPCWWVDKAHTLCSNPRCIAVIPLSEIELELPVE